MTENLSYDNVFRFFEQSDIEILDNKRQLKLLPQILTELNEKYGRVFTGNASIAIQQFIKMYKEDQNELYERYKAYSKDDLDDFLNSFTIKEVCE